jgi:hypothetical protein
MSAEVEARVKEHLGVKAPPSPAAGEDDASATPEE